MRKFYFLSLLEACAYLIPLAVTANDSCTAKFAYSSAANVVSFQSASGLSAGIVHWWIFGDGAPGNTQANPVHTYSTAGIYLVKHYVLNQATHCNDSAIKEIQVPQTGCNIEPGFSYNRDSQDCRKVHFINLSTPVPANVHFIWKFGDGSTSGDTNPTHIYPDNGNYNVCLVMERGNDCRKEYCKLVEVHCVTPPPCNLQAKFEWKKDSLDALKIWFINLSHPISNIWRTYWYYGDGTSSQDFNSFHLYQHQGKFYVCLKVQSLQGCIDTYCDSVVVHRPDTCERQVDFRYEVTANNPFEYRFKPAQVSLNWKYYWNFGDGGSSTAMAPIHRFEHAGLYKVCLTIAKNNLCHTTTCKEIRLNNRINCDSVRVKFEYVRNPLRPNELSFHAVGNVPVITQKWVIAKLGTSGGLPPIPVVIEANNPTYVFRDTGFYLVCLYATTLGDCKKIYCERITIDKVVNAPITGSPVNVYPNPVSHTARIEFQMETGAMVNLRVLDGAGSAKMELNVRGQAGNNYISIPVDKLSNGFYLVEIRYANRMKLAKFQKS
jgi:PKD repeat protein